MFFRRWAQRRAAKVETEHWRRVRHLLEAEERPVDYLEVEAPRELGLAGIVWLTDRRLIWTLVAYDGQSQTYHRDLPLSAIEGVDLADDDHGIIVLYKEPVVGQRMIGFRPTPQPRALVLLFIEQCRQLIRH